MIETQDKDEAIAVLDTIKKAEAAQIESGASAIQEVMGRESLTFKLWETNRKNLQSLVDNSGKKDGFRYCTEVVQLALLMLSKCGSTTYELLRNSLQCFPSLRVLTEIKGNIPVDDVGVIDSQLETMKMLFKKKLSKEKNAKLRGTWHDNPWNRMGVISVDACSLSGRVDWDYNHNVLTGLSQRDAALDIVGAQFEAAIKKRLTDAAGPEADPHGHTQYSRSFQAKHWLVMYWTSLGGLTQKGSHKPVSFCVGRWALDKIDAVGLCDCLDSMIMALADHDFGTIAVSTDGAGENIGFFEHVTMHCKGYDKKADGIYVKDFLTEAEAEAWMKKGVDVNQRVAFPNPSDRSRPIFFIDDMPHAVKTVRNGLDLSGRGDSDSYAGAGLGTQEVVGDVDVVDVGSKKPLPPDLKFPRPGADWSNIEVPVSKLFDVMNLRMLKRLVQFLKDKGVTDPLQLRTSKFSEAHFDLDRNSKMRVYLATQVLSATMARTIEEGTKAGMSAAEGSNSTVRNLPAADNYGALKSLCKHMNRLVDICNCRNDKKCYPFAVPDDPQINELLDIAAWFSKWKADLHSLAERGVITHREARSSRPADTTFGKVQRICLGLATMARYCLTRHDPDASESTRPRWHDKTYLESSVPRKITARRIQSDRVEVHFGNLRTITRGTADGLTVQNATRAEQTAAALTSLKAVSSRANHGGAQTDVGWGTTKLEDQYEAGTPWTVERRKKARSQDADAMALCDSDRE